MALGQKSTTQTYSTGPGIVSTIGKTAGAAGGLALGASAGGAAGSVLGPVGSIIGGLLGGLFGGLFEDDEEEVQVPVQPEPPMELLPHPDFAMMPGYQPRPRMRQPLSIEPFYRPDPAVHYDPYAERMA